jgi:hypothetical protein
MARLDGWLLLTLLFLGCSHDVTPRCAPAGGLSCGAPAFCCASPLAGGGDYCDQLLSGCGAHGGTPLQCFRAADCPASQICCASGRGGGPGSGNFCEDATACDGNGGLRACVSDGDCDARQRCLPDGPLRSSCIPK